MHIAGEQKDCLLRIIIIVYFRFRTLIFFIYGFMDKIFTKIFPFFEKIIYVNRMLLERKIKIIFFKIRF